MKGTYEYPDFPMKEEVYGVKPYNHIPGAVLHQYLTDYAKHYGVFERTQFNTKVESIESTAIGDIDGWLLSVANSKDGKTETISTVKLILATGLTSTPNFPQYQGKEEFGAPYFHAKDFCLRAEEVKDVKHATVVGGAKSAFDVAYALTEQGATVDLIVRPNGQGPVWLAPPFVTPFKVWMEKLLQTRFLTWFSPCPWGDEDKYPRFRNFLHGTGFGRKIVDTFWGILGGDVLSAVGYDKHPEVAKLKPWNSAFWIGSGLSIHNYRTDFWQLVKDGKIKVYIDNIDHLSQGKIHLESGTVLDSEAIICSTGWKKESSLKFKNLSEAGLGLDLDAEEKIKLNNQYDEKILSLYPRLKDQPQLAFEPKESDPYRMYRFIVPPTMVAKRNLAFAGMVSTINTCICATVQGLWISAFLDGQLDRVASTEDEITHEVMLHTQWGKWRYPCGYGASLPDMVFDALPYATMLLNDCGVNTHRKGGGVGEIFKPYGPEDFKGLIEEWKGTHGSV